MTALVTLALAAVAAAALAEVGRTALLQARLGRDGVRAWFLAEAGLADRLAAIAPGREFTALLTAASPPADDPATPWTYVASFRDDADDQPDDPLVDVNARVLLRVAASGPHPVRRRLEAVVGRAAEPFLPAAATLAGAPTALAGALDLDGHDFTAEGSCATRGSGPAKAGLALPHDAGLPPLPDPERIIGRGPSPSIARIPVVDLTPLGDAPGATRRPAGPVGGELGSPGTPRLTIVEGDAWVDEAASGSGILYVTGRLHIRGTLAFLGIAAAADGIELAHGGTLTVCGALWAAGARALEAEGRGTVRTSADALRLAAALAPLPAAARVIAVRELF